MATVRTVYVQEEFEDSDEHRAVQDISDQLGTRVETTEPEVRPLLAR